jgi:hypothetical protein
MCNLCFSHSLSRSSKRRESCIDIHQNRLGAEQWLLNTEIADSNHCRVMDVVPVLLYYVVPCWNGRTKCLKVVSELVLIRKRSESFSTYRKPERKNWQKCKLDILSETWYHRKRQANKRSRNIFGLLLTTRTLWDQGRLSQQKEWPRVWLPAGAGFPSSPLHPDHL